MRKFTADPQALFRYRGLPPVGLTVSMALQHLVAMIVGCVTPAIIIAHAAALTHREQVLLIQASLVLSAVTTLLQLFPIGGRFGSGLPVIFGVSFVYLPSMQAIATGRGGMAAVAGAMLVGGVITAGLGLFTLAKPQVVASFLPVVFGIFIVVDGCSRIGSAIDLAKRKGEKWWMLLLFSIVSIALDALLIWHPFGAAVSVVMLCGILLIVEGALNLGCILYAAMELRTLDRMANAAVNATLTALGDALDEAEAAESGISMDGPVVYNAESKDVSDEE